MNAMHGGRLIALSVVAAVLALGAVTLTYLIGAPVWLGTVVAFVLVAVLTLAARRAQVKRWGFERRYWSIEYDSKAVQVVFDERLIFLNRLTLLVDGSPVDHTTIWYGTKELRGGGVAVVVGSGWIGECTGVGVRDEKGTLLALSEHS